MRRRPRFDSDPDIEAEQSELVASGVLAPLALGSDEEQLWLDCDIALLAENRLGDPTDPRLLDEARRAEWLARALTEKPWLPRDRHHERCYWLLDRDARAGTIAIGKSSLGGSLVRVTSLYVFATHRGRGTARGTLERLRDGLGRRGLGICLDTSWTWQHAVRFYLRIGMWVRSWKRDLTFQWHKDTPAPRMDVGQDRSSLLIRSDRSAEDVLLIAAERAGDRLLLKEPDDLGEFEHLRLHAMSTLGVALALGGWPLVRSPEDWDEWRVSDFGPPESLAYKITIWEAWNRKHGWQVNTPSIPGLDYPNWDELQAQWNTQP